MKKEIIVRLVVRLEERSLVGRLIHRSQFEPVVIDAAKGVVAFDVPHRSVEAILDDFAVAGVGQFLATLKVIPAQRIK